MRDRQPGIWAMLGEIPGRKKGGDREVAAHFFELWLDQNLIVPETNN
jgi:hypothetical protein